MKALRLCCLAAAAVFCLTGCSGTQTPSENTQETLVVHQALPLPDLSVKIPDTFETTSSEHYEEYYICDDASIIITEDTSGAPYNSAYDYAVSALVQYEDMAHSVTDVKEDVVYSGKYAVQTLEFTYTLDQNDEYPLHSIIGYMTDSASMYIITCKSSADTFEKHREEFLSVLQSAYIVK